MNTPRFVCTSLALFLATIAGTASAQPPRYHLDVLQPLSPPPPGQQGGAGIAAFGGPGIGVGQSRSGADTFPVRWMGATAQQLPVPDGWNGSIARDINRDGLIVGQISKLTPVPGPSRAVFWRDGVMSELPAPAGSDVSTAAVNDAGVIIGNAYLESQPLALAWSDGGYTELQPLPGHDMASVAGINNSGVMVGGSSLGSTNRSPVVWRNGVPTELPLPPWAPGGVASHINDNGDIIGGYQGGVYPQAILWHDGLMTYFPEKFMSFNDINNPGDVVGEQRMSVTGTPEGILYTGGSIYKLSDLLDAASTQYRIELTGAIADDGRISATARLIGGHEQVSVLLTPVPTPATPTFLGVALTSVLARRRSRIRAARAAVPAALAVVCASAATAAAQPPRYAVTVIGTLTAPDGYGHSAPFGLNNRGEVVGYSQVDRRLSGFIYAGSTLKPLPGSFGPADAIASGINDSGVVVGSTHPLPGADPCFRAVSWRGDTIIDLGTLGGSWARADAIDKRGRIVGSSALPGDQTWNATLWDGGAIINLGSLPGLTQSMATDISDTGYICGHCFPAEGHGATPVLWRGGVIQALPTDPYFIDSYAYKVNDAGHAIGESWNDLESQAVLWRDGSYTLIGPIAEYGIGVYLADLNNREQIVGTNVDPSTYDFIPFLWENGVFYPLRAFLAPGYDSIELLTADRITDAGLLAGTAMIDGSQTAVLLTPIHPTHSLGPVPPPRLR